MRIGKARKSQMYYNTLESDHKFTVETEGKKAKSYPYESFEDVIRFFICENCGYNYQVTKTISKFGNETFQVYRILDEDTCCAIQSLVSCKQVIMQKALE